MLGADIKHFFALHPNLKKRFKGVFAADQLWSLSLQNKTAAVVNTDSLNGPGKHWYTIIKLENRLGTNIVTLFGFEINVFYYRTV